MPTRGGRPKLMFEIALGLLRTRLFHYLFLLWLTLIEFHCFERVLALACPLFKLLKRFRNFPDADSQH